MSTRVTGTGPAEMKALAVKLKAADPKLRRELRRQFRDAARPVADAARRAVLGSPSRHGGTLRAEIAATVSAVTSITASGVQVSIVSAGSKMPAGKGTLPARFNDDSRFRHPVFGHRATWVKQDSHADGWFDVTIAARAADLRRAAEAAMDATARQLGS